MKVLQIGSLAISVKWIILGAAFLIGLIFIKIWLNRSTNKETSKNVYNLFSSSLLLLIVIWKGSLLLLQPKLILKSPLSVLYFTGGVKGLLIAILITLLYFAYKAKKLTSYKVIIQSLIIFSMVVTSVFYFGNEIYDTTLEGKKLKNRTEVTTNIGIQEGQKAPEFTLETLDGKELKLSDMRGKKVILNFWATWCPPCKAEMPHMQEFYQEQKSNGVEILAVNLTTAEKNRNDVGPFVEDYGLTFPILLDNLGDIGEMYQAFTIPTSYIIDSNGVIRKKIVGPMDKELMKELIDHVN